MESVRRHFYRVTAALAAVLLLSGLAVAGNYVFTIRGEKTYLNGHAILVKGLRCSNALISDQETQELIDNLDTFAQYGVNTVSVYFMGSRFGDVKGYNEAATLNPVYAGRMGRIIEAADRRGMMVLVGCLYWSTYSKKEGYYNYINIGVYTDAMKAEQIEQTKAHLSRGEGYMLASTWLQGISPYGPNQTPGGDGTQAHPGIKLVAGIPPRRLRPIHAPPIELHRES